MSSLTHPLVCTERLSMRTICPLLNAWCELRSPSQQVGEGQTGATKLLVEPHAEVVQRYPRRQTRSQTLKVVGTLSPQAEGIEQLVVDRLHDLPYPGNPLPQALGPASLTGVALGRMDHIRTIAFEPAPVVLRALEALVGYIGPRESRAHADEPSVRSGSQGEEGLGQRLVGYGGGPETKARYGSRWSDSSQKGEAFVPPYTVGPTDVGLSGEPAIPPALGVSDGHGRTVQGLVSTLRSLHQLREVQGHLLDKVRLRAQEAVELGAIRKGKEGLSEVACSVAVEIPLAGEPAPAGEDGQGNDLALTEGGLGTRPPFWRVGVAEVLDRKVECSEEGVLRSSMRSRFLSQWDRWASRL